MVNECPYAFLFAGYTKETLYNVRTSIDIVRYGYSRRRIKSLPDYVRRRAWLYSHAQATLVVGLSPKSSVSKEDSVSKEGPRVRS